MTRTTQERNRASSIEIPLVVDLDGTLTVTDTLHESVIQFVKQSPLNLFVLPLWLVQGKARFKERLASKVRLSPENLPYREDLLTYLHQEREKGRPLVLATAAHESIALCVSEHIGLFSMVLASRLEQNLRGPAKLKAILEHVGDKFVYAGDNKADLPIWKASQAAVLVGVTKSTADSVKSQTIIQREFPRQNAGLPVWLRALRVHQWLKNLLLFVPLLTAFSFLEFEKLAMATNAFLAFSLAASATYVVNDILDLESDRRHPRKRLRPFASAQLSIPSGLAVAAFTLTLALILSLVAPKTFFLTLIAYLFLTSIYSWVLKEYVLVDVLTLSLLYTLRILAGSAAVAISTSSWLLVFSVFVFLSLALVKRCAELVSLQESGAGGTRGRDYRVSDLVVLWPMGVGAALSAVVVFGLFITAPDTRGRYESPELLWLVALGLTYWLARLWVKTSRGEMHDDPVVFAIKDRGSRVTVFGMIVLMLSAHSIDLSALF